MASARAAPASPPLLSPSLGATDYCDGAVVAGGRPAVCSKRKSVGWAGAGALGGAAGWAGELEAQMAFPPDLALLAAECGLAEPLLRAVKAGALTPSEDDPLLLLLPQLRDQDCAGYFSHGNYGLAAGRPGAAAAPAAGAVPAGDALRGFMLAQPGVSDCALGAGHAFYVADYAHVFALQAAVHASPQFRRLGPTTAGLVGAPAQAALLVAVTLNTVRGPPQAFGTFNRV